MKKSKKSSEEPRGRDRLSELPDSIIFEIFWLLPMTKVVQTTVLSRRWKNLWTTTPYLNFDGYYKSIFIYRALILWRGLKILKFKFGRDSVRKKSVFRDLNVWVRLAKDNGIEELYLDEMCLHFLPSDEAYSLPLSMYSCSSLKVLSLRDCCFERYGNVQWNQLKSLTVEGFYIDQNFIDKVICGSPQLEVLVIIINLELTDRNLSIQSSRLKKLSVGRLSCGVDYIVPELKIWSPNLDTLEIIGKPYGKCSLLNISSLTHLTLDFSERWYHKADYLGEIFEQIFPTIQHVEKLTLSDWWIKGLGAVKEKYLLSPLSNFKFLTINRSDVVDSKTKDERDVAYEEIFDILPFFPKLEILVLRSTYNLKFENHDTSFLQVERNLPESFLLQLRTVDITLCESDYSIFPFIENMLKHASNLQKMVIRVKVLRPYMPSARSLCLALQQKVLRMPRSSPTAELIFHNINLEDVPSLGSTSLPES